jgi:L-arabinose isomerase
VGLLALTLDLYETLAPDLRSDREQWLFGDVIPALQTIATVQFEKAVFRADDIDKAVSKMERHPVDVILVICLTYSPSLNSLPALQRTRLPIVIWNTQEAFHVDENLEQRQLIENHGVHGTQDLSNVLLREGVPFEYVTSHLRDPGALEKLADVLGVATAVSRLRRMQIGILGYPFPGMGDIDVDRTHLAATLGCRAVGLEVADFNRVAQRVTEDEVTRIVSDYRESYDVAAAVTDEDLVATARVELSLREMIAEHGLEAISYQFLALGNDDRTLTLPFVAVSRVMADGIGFAGEGDLVGATGTWLLNQLQTPATFSEIFTVDFEGNALLMSHMGEANASMARRDRKTPLIVRDNKIAETRNRQLTLAISLEPGPATLCCLTLGPDERWKLLAGHVAIEDFGPLPSIASPHFKVRVPSNVRDWLDAYGKAGGAHHHALCFGNALAKIRTAAMLLRAEYVEIA